MKVRLVTFELLLQLEEDIFFFSPSTFVSVTHEIEQLLALCALQLSFVVLFDTSVKCAKEVEEHKMTAQFDYSQ